MDIDVQEASKRGDYGCERYEVTGFQNKVQELFQILKEPSWNVSQNLLYKYNLQNSAAI